MGRNVKECLYSVKILSNLGTFHMKREIVRNHKDFKNYKVRSNPEMTLKYIKIIGMQSVQS